MPSQSRELLTKLKAAYQVCPDCGAKHGTSSNGLLSTCWHDTCDVCGKVGAVTEARDYGFLWKGIRDLTSGEGKTDEKTKYVSKIQSILVENTQSMDVTGVTEIFLNDEGAGAYISLKQDVHEITLDPEEIDLVFNACKTLLNQ